MPAMAVPDALSQPMSLELFEGPFDLLLTLVLREEVDLLELPLAEVVKAAMGHRTDERWDTNTAGELVVLLAAMAELKARVLLGEAADEEPDPDTVEARELLAARVLAYVPFQRAARWMAERAQRAAGPRYRRVPLPAGAEARPVAEDPRALRGAFEALLVGPPEPSLDHIHARRVSLPQALERLEQALERARILSFDELTKGMPHLDEAITLMAALELARRGEVRLIQDEPFGDIAIVGGR